MGALRVLRMIFVWVAEASRKKTKMDTRFLFSPRRQTGEYTRTKYNKTNQSCFLNTGERLNLLRYSDGYRNRTVPKIT